MNSKVVFDEWKRLDLVKETIRINNEILCDKRAIEGFSEASIAFNVRHIADLSEKIKKYEGDAFLWMHGRNWDL